MYFISSDDVIDFELCGWFSFFKKRLITIRVCDISMLVDDPANTIFYYASSVEHAREFSDIVRNVKVNVFVVIVTAHLEEQFSIRNIASIFKDFSPTLLVDDYKLISRLSSIATIKCYVLDPIFDALPQVDCLAKEKSILVLYSSDFDVPYSKKMQCDYLKIDKGIFLQNEHKIFNKLLSYKFIVLYDCNAYTDHLIVFAALGRVILDLSGNFYLRCIYPAINTSGFSLDECYDYILQILDRGQYHQYLVDYAISYSKKFFSVNCFVRLIPHSSVAPIHFFSNEEDCFFNAIAHISGRLDVSLNKNQFCVFCLMKNGIFFIKDWLEYYRELGAAHFYIVDNNSTDGTREYLMTHADVTVFFTELPFKYYEAVIRNFIVSTYCKNVWCLSVDIDEFFDYPHSDQIAMHDFISYQNINGYTAVIANMLDMFSSDSCDYSGMSLRENYRNYDSDLMQRHDYSGYSKDLHLSNHIENAVNVVYSGGVRKQFCQVSLPIHEYLLVKHSLTFQDGCLDPHINPHFCDRGIISDVTCVLYHYKFVDANVAAVIERMNAQDTGIFVAYEYDAYIRFYQENSGFVFFTNTMRLLSDHQSVLDAGVFNFSSRYIKYVKGW